MLQLEQETLMDPRPAEAQADLVHRGILALFCAVRAYVEFQTQWLAN
jgi:hypothetical protein